METREQKIRRLQAEQVELRKKVNVKALQQQQQAGMSRLPQRVRIQKFQQEELRNIHRNKKKRVQRSFLEMFR